MVNKRLIGDWGEDIASDFLEKEGIKIIEKNFRCKLGEIDIIAEEDDYLLFIEVKYRKDLSHGYPREAVTFHKQRTIAKVALWYLKKYNLWHRSCRFDVLEILGEKPDLKICLIRNAFVV
ncbi:MAG TPA: YraN family protein [Defluviitaleaceae bacterium]|nr:YraN family protein [Candidatus Epulonipiscium sp.]HOQ15951.1 YraN family protein [Defluviitaleaceae bacterium]HPT76225.1 YraN family protein [Defluviitaleaceae bacterium]HQD51069.1 YraN family protein [Defluviitaleaceae bacterium]